MVQGQRWNSMTDPQMRVMPAKNAAGVNAALSRCNRRAWHSSERCAVAPLVTPEASEACQISPEPP